jgi:GDP-4-dehydro-6-deoxy-D-mannose reductase
LIGPGQSSGVSSIFAKKITAMENKQEMGKLDIENIHVQRDFLDVRDAVVAYEFLLNKGDVQKIYEIGSGVSRSLMEVVNTLLLFSEERMEYHTDPRGEPQKPFVVDISNITALGWLPRISFEQSMKDILDYYRETGGL